MPISGTGPSSSATFRAAGFTLLEVMVVVTIIGVMLVVVRISLPDRAADALKLESQRFVQTLNDCRDTAVLSGSPTGIRIAARRYDLARYHRGWQALAANGSSSVRVLPDEIELSVPAVRGARVEQGPAVVCLPSGETRVSKLVLRHQREQGYYRFFDNADGEFVAEWVSPPT